jgi:single-strand DNA-binding protein
LRFQDRRARHLPNFCPVFLCFRPKCTAVILLFFSITRGNAAMAKSVNKVILLGNVGKDPEIRSTPGGTMVANFTLATSDRQKDAQGNWQDRTEWHNLVAFTRTAEIIRDYVKKGSKLYVEGKIQTRSWDDKESGAKRYRTEIIVNDLSLLSGRDEGNSGGYSRSSSSAGSSSGSSSGYDQRAPANQDDYAQSAEISDDDIPF